MWELKSAAPKLNPSLKPMIRRKRVSEAQRHPSCSLWSLANVQLKQSAGTPGLAKRLNGIWRWREGSPREDNKSYLIPKEVERDSRSKKGFSSVFVLALCRPDTAAAQGIPWGLGLHLLALPGTTAPLPRAREGKQESLNPSPNLCILYYSFIHQTGFLQVLCNPPCKTPWCYQ